jgi:HEPN domain-containing protein
MKQTTKDWLTAAEDDLLSAKKLVSEERLTNIVAFHCQQCLEKALKAIIEEQSLSSLKSHDLLRLSDKANIQYTKIEFKILATINEVYIDARYPGDMGLMPNGKPTISEVDNYIQFSETLFNRLKQKIKL